MQRRLHVEADISDARRVLVGGDVHGHADLLREAMDRVGYDPTKGDRLILLGDLLDRGPDVEGIMRMLDEDPNIVCLLGNHCDMLTASVGVTEMDDHANPFTLFRNGGAWLLDHAPAHADLGELMKGIFDVSTMDQRMALFELRIVELARRMAASPVAMTVKTPGDRTIGLVHGDVPAPTWSETVAGLMHDDPQTARHWIRQCCWSRNRFDWAKRTAVRGGSPDPAMWIPDIDHVFMGHSITKEPLIMGNCSWIDTGSYKHGLVTIVDVDEWISRIGGKRP